MKLGKRFAVLGAGKIGQTLIGGILDAGLVSPRDLLATAKHRESADLVSHRFRIQTTTDNARAAKFGDILIVSVKPQALREVVADIASAVTEDKLIISTVASAPTAFFEGALGKNVPVIRTMPNTPCLIRAGMTGIAPGKYVKKEHLQIAQTIFNTLGRSMVLDERHMDAVTGLSGSGPAFMYIVVEALAEGGVKVGLPREVATLLAAQTMMGAGKMIVETGMHPAMLKDAVTTPAGCTIDGIMALEEGGLRVTLIKAVVQATQRAAELFQNHR